MTICKLCKKQLRSNKGLGKHLSQTHKSSFESYILKYSYGDKPPLCLCGCGNSTSFKKTDFAKFLHGHNNRDKVWPKHVLQKRIDTNKKKYGVTNSMFSDEIVKKLHKTNLSRYGVKYALENADIHKKTIESYYRNYTPESSAIRQEKKRKTCFQKYGVSHPSQTKEARERMSKVTTKNLMDGRAGFITGEYFSIKNTRKLIYRSSWEKKYMILLDLDKSVQSWNYESFYISYVKDGVAKCYIPDFFVVFNDGRKEIHEVGPLKVKKSGKEKVRAAKKICSKINAKYKIVHLDNDSFHLVDP